MAYQSTPKKLEDLESRQSNKLYGINGQASAKENYFGLLREWMKQTNVSQNLMIYFPYYLMACYPQLFQIQRNIEEYEQQNFPRDLNNIGAAASVTRIRIAGRNIGEPRIGDHFDIINRFGGYEFVIAAFWKRVLAELVDVAILLLLKVMITFTVINLFDLDLGFEFDKTLKNSLKDDYTEFLTISTDLLSFSSDLLVLEILTKVIVCFYEAVWTMSSRMYVGGATPGKLLLGLRIVYVEAVVPLNPMQPTIIFRNPRTPVVALLYPAENPGFQRAFLRAVTKNVLIALLFPMCFLMLFFKNNRTAYDIMTKTMVVEENRAPILTR